jgi:hypothetical protein
MVNRCSKFLHFGRKSWGEFEKPTPEGEHVTFAIEYLYSCGSKSGG